MASSDEARRIRAEYARREREISPSRYSDFSEPALYMRQQRDRRVLALLSESGLSALAGLRILDVGCGRGDWLCDFEAWGATRGALAGIDLEPARVARARERLAAVRDENGRLLSPGADLREGDAASLPWPDASFDLVVEGTMISSVLDRETRQAIAREMVRVLAPRGAILWYDFSYDNPSNPAVRGVHASEIQALFPGFRVHLRRVTLAPPLTRLLVPWTWVGALCLEGLVILNTHYLGLFRRQET